MRFESRETPSPGYYWVLLRNGPQPIIAEVIDNDRREIYIPGDEVPVSPKWVEKWGDKIELPYVEKER